jgi:hypothetical protein
MTSTQLRSVHEIALPFDARSWTRSLSARTAAALAFAQKGKPLFMLDG